MRSRRARPPGKARWKRFRYPVADELAVGVERMGREALLLQDLIGRSGDVLQRVEQGAVEVEQHRADMVDGRLGQRAYSLKS